MKNVFLNVRTAKAQAGCAKLKDTSLSFRRGLGRGFLFTFLLLTLGVGQMWANKTYLNGDIIYYDFRNVTSGSGDGVNWQGSSWEYDGSGRGTVKTVVFSGEYTFNSGSTVCAKTAKGSWTDIKWSDPGTGQNCLQISSDGKSFTWTTYYPNKYIAGGNASWLSAEWNPSSDMMTNNNDGTYSITVSDVSAVQHKFKLCNGSWGQGEVGWSSTRVSCVNGTCSGDNDGADIKFTPSVAGSVTVTYNSNTDKIVISCPTQWQLQSTGSGSPHGTFTGSGDGPYTLDVTYNSSTMNWGAVWFWLSGTKYICNNYTVGTSGKLDLRTGDQTAITGITNGGSYTFTITKESGTWKVQIAANCTAPTIAWNTTPSNGTAGESMTASVTTNQTSPTITWNSSNTSAATVNSSGVINYVAAGSTRITASYTGNGSTHCATTVSVYQDITVESNNYTWKLKQNNTELGTFSSDGNNTYHLDFEVTAGYNSDLHFFSTEASIDHAPSSETHLGSANKRTMVNDGGRNSWNDGIGKYRFYIQKISSTWYLYAERLYSVSYNGNSQSSGTAPSTTYHLAGSNVTVASNSGSLAKTGYDFGGWNENSSGTGTNYAAGSGVISSISADKNLFAKWTVASYTISASNSNVTYSPASGTSFTYGSTGSKMTVTPKSGYKITNITSNNGAITASADNNAAGSWTVTGTMPAANVTLTVTTAAVSTVYLQGRFRIRTASGVESYKSLGSATASGWSSEWVTSGTSQISMTYNYATGVYDLATYRSAAELKNDGNLYFYLCVGGTNTYPTSSNLTVPSSKPGSANAQTSTGNNFYFNDNGDYINVILHYDAANKKLWYTGTAETTYSTTCYAGDHGSINAKGTAIAKNGNSSVNIGTGSPISATPESGYSFDYWETSGSVTVADIYSVSTTVTASAAGGTVTAHYIAKSNWYLHGQIDGEVHWESEGNYPHNWPVDHSYRGVSGVYFRPISTINSGGYFGAFYNDTQKYSGDATSSDCSWDGSYHNLVANNSNCFKTSAEFSNKWVVINTGSSPKKIWIQSPATYYTLSVTSANGTVTLTENNYGGLETNQFASGDRVNISVTASSGYWIDDITIGETSVATNVNASTYSGYTTMPSGAATLTVTYNRYYTLTYDANYYTSETGGTAPSASSYVSGSNVTVAGKGDLTMTNYTFSGWNTDPHITGTNYAEGANIEMTGNITLYGVWKRTIPFELEDADPEFVMATVYGTYNCTTLTDYDNPTKDGYTFGGWWTNIAGGDNYVISPEKELQPGVYHWTNYDNKTNEFMRKPSSESSLFAKWTQTVTLNANLANHGSGTDKSASVTYKKNALTSITHCTPAAGYELDGYYTAATDGVKVLNADGSFAGSSVTDYITEGKWTKAGATTLYAHYEGNTYTVTLAPNGGSGSNQTVTATYDAAMPPTLSGGGAIVAPSKTGYAFGGYWYESTQYYAANLSSVTNWNRTSATTLNAKWTPKQSALTFDYQTSAEGYGASGSIAAVSATYGAAMPALTGNMPTAAQGYAFMGFYSGVGGTGTKYYNPDKTSAHNWDVDTESTTTLYAYYKKSEITGITFTPGNIVAPSATVTVTATIEPTPVGPTTICWRVLYYSNDNPLDPQPTFTPVSGETVSFPAHSASGSYKVEATLRKGTGCGGDEIHTFTAPFQVAGNHTVTVQYKCGDVTIKASTTTTGRPLNWSDEITPPEIFGYTFSKWKAGDGVTMTIDGGETTIGTGGETTGKATTHAVQIKANYDGKLIAIYTKKSIIYFKNTLGWDKVYVNIMNNQYWDVYNGSGNSNNYYARNQQMTLLDGTDDIYYLEYSGSTSVYMSFTSMSQDNYQNFWAGDGDHLQVVYPTHPFDNQGEQTNYGYNAGTPMFVPTAEQTPIDKHIVNNGRASYYNKGYWRKYDPIQGETGYTLKVYNKTSADGRTELKSIKFVESDVPGQLFKAVANLEAAGGYGIKFERDNSMLYTNTTGHLHRTGDVVVTDKQNDDYKAIWIKATAAGDYTFAITINGDGKLCIQAEFPVAANDYRVIYTDNDTWTKAHTAESWIHPSRIINAVANAVDTISFFVSKGHSPEFKIQKVNAINETTGAITWTDVTSWTSCNDVTATGIYNFIFTQDGSKNISFTKKEPYIGEFYIRTNCAGASKWDNYKHADHLMTYSQYSEEHSDFSHYFMGHVYGGTNIKFVVANDYSPCISDTLIVSTGRYADAAHVWASDGSGHIAGDLKADEANIRFMWNRANNAVYRAYLAPAQSDGSKFLVLRGTTSDNLKDENGNPLRNASNSGQAGYNHKAPDYCIQFVDDENWIYETTVQVIPSSYVKLYAFFNSVNIYYKGTEDDTFDGSHAIQLVTGKDDGAVKVRVLYDFKTDRLVAAYLPSGEISTEMDINADVMFIREHQGDIAQLTFSGEGAKIMDIKTAYAVMRFNKWTLNNKEKTGSHNPLASPASIYERSLYYISFPFRVKLSEVFGFGTYGQHWIIQRYRGDLRAQTGWWEGQPGFWEFIWNRNGEVYLEPNQGYILTLETELLGETSDVWGPDHLSNQIELFFPSTGDLGSITNSSVVQTLPAHTCTINRAATEGLPDTDDPRTSYNRTVFDSHWNIMSVPTYVNVNNPSFANTTWIGGGKGNVGPKFLYTWNMNDNTLTATSGTGFMYHAMHAYTVQYYGNVTWTTSVSPAAAPQRNTEYRGEYEFCLEVQQDEQMIDRTFVRLSDDENVTTGFEFGEDMTKQFNSRKANIFTIAGNTSLGGNSLPMSENTTIVPVGVVVKKTGDYTFSIPEGTNGIGITLIDEETGIRTSLSALDYTVELAAGDYTERFWLEISPVKGAETGIDPGVDARENGVRKVMIDGLLYIVRDGKMFDARGARVE